MNKIEQYILNIRFVRYLTAKSKNICLPGFQKVPLYEVIKFFISQVNKVGLNERAAAISFNLLMAIPAATIFICTLIPYMPISKQITTEVLLLTKDFAPNENTYLLAYNFLNDFLMTPRSGLLSFGAVVAIYYASNALICIMESFNRSLLHRKHRNFIQDRWTAIKLTTVLMMLFMTSVTLLVMEGALLKWILDFLNIDREMRFWVISLRWLVIIALYFYAIAFIYKYAPAIHKRWRLNSPGAIVATFLGLVSFFLFSWYVNNFESYNKIYGSIGTIMIIMFLIFLNSLILLVGYELNVSIHSLKAMADERQKLEAKLSGNGKKVEFADQEKVGEC